MEEKTTKRNKTNNLNRFSKSKILKLKQNFPKNQYMFPQTFNQRSSKFSEFLKENNGQMEGYSGKLVPQGKET